MMEISQKILDNDEGLSMTILVPYEVSPLKNSNISTLIAMNIHMF